MKNIYKNIMFRQPVSLWIISLLVVLFANVSVAQVFKPFQQRTSSQAPVEFRNKQIYNLRGDFKMIGNTNLRVSGGSGANSESNSNTTMVLVDGDGVATTANSSSAELVLPATCTNIVYAGLYWSGRRNNNNNASTSNTSNYASPSSDIQSTGLNVNISTRGDNSTGTIIYTISNTSNSVYYQYELDVENDVVRVKTSSSGAFVTIPSSELTVSTSGTTNSGTRTISFLYPTTFTIGNQVISINNLQRRRGSPVTNSSNRNVNITVITNNGASSNKIRAKIRKGTGAYTNLVADDYYIGDSSQDGIFTAYKDVTNYVQTNGAGNYWVADLDLNAGNGSSVGYFGGWGMVIIYENPTMKWRDITVFDGYAYVSGGASYELPLSGFNAAQNGAVNVTMGMMAGEGDRSISGDAFRIRNAANTSWQNLSHSGNTTSNFFNSSILTDGSRTPNLVNNTGLDIVKFDLTNTSNSLIANNQTSTRFQYANNGGGGEDTYVIYNIVFAVDAYVPEALPINMATKITTKGTPSDPSRVITDPVEITSYMNILQPGDELEMEIKIINTGNERVLGSNIEMVIPKELELVPGTLGMTTNTNASTFAGTTTEIAAAQAAVNAFSQPVWTPAVALPNYEGGTVAWNLGTIPVQPPNSDPFQVTPMAIMKYTLKVTENCDYLKYSNATCMVAPKLSGGIAGVGENSGTSMADQGFITGIINANCRIYQIGTLDFQVPVKEEYLLENCKNDNIIKDVNLNYPCGNTVQGNSFNISTHDFLYKTDAELLADNDPATMPGQLVPRYPVGTWFFDVVPSSGVVTPLSLNNTTMSVDVTNSNGIHTGYLYAVIPEHQVSAPGPYTCYYIVTIKIDTTVEKPKVPANTIEKCSGENYDYNVFVETSTVGNVGFLYSRKVNGVWQTLSNVKPLPNSPGIYEYGVEQVVYGTNNIILCRSAMAEYDITIKGCKTPVNPMIYTPLNR